MKTFRPIFFLLLTCLAVSAQEARVQFVDEASQAPKRVVGDKVYNVIRQSNLWTTVTATYLRPQLYTGGWVVTGKLNDTNATFVLRNPPADVLQQFVRLKATYQQVKAEYQQAQSEYDEVAREHEDAKLTVAQLKANPEGRPGSKLETRWGRDLAKATDDEQNLDQKSTILADKVKRAKADMDRLEATGFDFNSDFSFTCPIMRVPLTVEKLPVYDRGRILQ